MQYQTNPTTQHKPNRSRHRRRSRTLFAPLLFVLALLAAACGGDPVPISAPANAGSGESAAPPAAQTPEATALIGEAESDVGPILVNGDGFSLYGFTNDTDGQSNCDGGCANAWPPVLVPSADLPAGLDPALFSVIQRSDATFQLQAGKWPLYLFAGDTAAGQTTGHLSGDVWFLAAPDGSLIGVEAPAAEQAEAAAPAPAPAQADEPETAAATPVVAVGSTSLGDVLVSGAGLTLYGFTNDADGVPTCEGGCAEAWPPLLIADGVLPADLDGNVFSVVQRPDGKTQLKAGKWPLYLFAGDTAPGLTTGHLSGGVWFAANPTGGLIDAPAPDPEPAEAAAAPEAASEPTEAYGSAEAAPAAPVSVGSTLLGDVLVNVDGLTLYGFKNDVDGLPTCVGGCAEAWPPLLVTDGALPSGLDASIFSVVSRADGTSQLKAGKWPLYLFAGDTAPGQTTGHLSGDVWFAASPTGGLIGAAAPAPEAPAAVDEPAEAAPVAPAPVAPAPVAPAPVQPAPTPTPYDY